MQQLYTLSKPPVNPRFIDVGTGVAPWLHRRPFTLAAIAKLLRQREHALACCALPACATCRIPGAGPCRTGMRLRYLEWNSGGEDAVLLLHDIGECTDVWGPLAERLRQRGYRVIALDLRGAPGGRARDKLARCCPALLLGAASCGQVCRRPRTALALLSTS